MTVSNIDTYVEDSILTPEEVARYLNKSVSWVYKHWKILGGRKLGGSLFFPRKDELYERIFCKGQGLVEVRLCPEKNQINTRRIQNENPGKKSRGKKKGGTRKTEERDPDANRHGILGSAQPET